MEVLRRVLSEYLLQHSGHEGGRSSSKRWEPIDALSLHRKLLRHYIVSSPSSNHSRQQQQQKRVLERSTADTIIPLLHDLANVGAIKIDSVRAGPKTIVMILDTSPKLLKSLMMDQTIEQQQTQQGQQLSSSKSQSISPSNIIERGAQREAKGRASPAAVFGNNLASLLSKPTALESLATERFKKTDTLAIHEYCQYGTRAECFREKSLAAGGGIIQEQCRKLHFKRVLESHTDPSLGDCAYLSTCRRTRTCKYIHYEIEEEGQEGEDDQAMDQRRSPAVKDSASQTKAFPPLQSKIHTPKGAGGAASASAEAAATAATITTMAPQNITKIPAQWVNTDVRNFDLSVLGQFSVIMADPPWEIHMDLPYGTMTDDDIARLGFPKLQQKDGGLLFLWVTGRAMERARELFDFWGYCQLEEIIWIKTNQLQKIIRTGRTGHWLNHSKEHCLVGVKGNPRVNRHLDCDVIVAEVRETSRKPDEIYDIIERLSPGTRKVEIFGRQNNIREGWVTVGNQLPPTRLIEPDVVQRYEEWQEEKKRTAAHRPQEQYQARTVMQQHQQVMFQSLEEEGYGKK